MSIQINKAALGDPLVAIERHASEPSPQAGPNDRHGFASLLQREIDPERHAEPADRPELARRTTRANPTEPRERSAKRSPDARRVVHDEHAEHRGQRADGTRQRRSAKGQSERVPVGGDDESSDVQNEDAVATRRVTDGTVKGEAASPEDAGGDDDVARADGNEPAAGAAGGEDNDGQVAGASADESIAATAGASQVATLVLVAEDSSKADAVPVDKTGGPVVERKAKRLGMLRLVASLGHPIVPQADSTVAAARVGGATNAKETPVVESVSGPPVEHATPNELAGVLARPAINDNGTGETKLAQTAIAATTGTGAVIHTGGGPGSTATVMTASVPSVDSRPVSVVAASGSSAHGAATHLATAAHAAGSSASLAISQVASSDQSAGPEPLGVSASVLDGAGAGEASADKSARDAHSTPWPRGIAGYAEAQGAVRAPILRPQPNARLDGLAASVAKVERSDVESGAGNGAGEGRGDEATLASTPGVKASAPSASGQGPAGAVGTIEGGVRGASAERGARPAAAMREPGNELETPAPAATPGSPSRVELDVGGGEGQGVRLVVETVGNDVRVRARAASHDDADQLRQRVGELRTSLRDHGLELRTLDAGALGGGRRHADEGRPGDAGAGREQAALRDTSQRGGESGARRESSTGHDVDAAFGELAGSRPKPAAAKAAAGDVVPNHGRRLNVVA